MRVQAKAKYRNAAGVVIPSVTTALNILNKPALVKWANKLGLEGIDSSRYRDALADIGTLTHYLIMCRLNEELPDTSDYTPEQVELAEGCYKKYVDWELRNPVKPILVEEQLVSEKYQYGGTPDLYALSNRVLMLADFKTNAKGIFAEMIYQVAAYRHLLQEAGYTVSKTCILRLGRSTSEGAEERILSEGEMEVGFQIFLRCLEIHQLTTNGMAGLHKG